MSQYLQPPEPYKPPRRDRESPPSSPSSLPEPTGAPRSRPAGYRPSSSPLPPPPAPEPPSRHWGRLFIVGALAAVVLALLLPLAAGVYVGTQERAAYLHSQAVAHFQQALAYESENYTELAVAELQIAVKFDPTYAEAQEKLDQLKTTESPPGTPTPASATIADQLWKRAQAAIDAEQWGDAIDDLQEIKQADAKYRADDVNHLLIQAYLNGGKQSVTMGKIDEAQTRFQDLLALAPDNAEAQGLLDECNLYLTGTQAMSTSPSSAVTTLLQLYQEDPTFYDVKGQLFDAYVSYGDATMKQGSSCIAAREYAQAANLGSGDVSTKLQQANASCKAAISATATPSVTPGAGTPGPTVPTNLGGFTVQSHIDTQKACEGLGSIEGTVLDSKGSPVPGYKVKIYNDADYKPAPFTPEANGRYSIVLGNSPGLFHLVILGPNGQPASGVYNVNYPGGLGTGCHVIVDWTKNP